MKKYESDIIIIPIKITVGDRLESIKAIDQKGPTSSTIVSVKREELRKEQVKK